MELLVAIAIALTVVAACAWFRFRPKFNLRPVPVAALMVLIVGSVFGHEFFRIETGPIPITLDRVLLLATLAIMGVLIVLGREELRVFNGGDIAIVALMTLLSLSTITHDWTLLGNLPASRLLFFNLMPATLYWIVRTSRIGVPELKFIAVTLGMFGVYLSLTAIAEYKEITALVFPRYILSSETTEFLGRGRGPFLNPISNGIFQATCCCCLLMWWPRTTNLTRVALVVPGIVMLLGVYATLTRSVWLGLALSMGVFVWLPSSRQAKGAMILAATLLMVLGGFVASERFVSFKRDKNVSLAEMKKSAQLRPMFLTIACNMFEDRPIAGVGFGQYSQAKYPYLQDPHSGQPLSRTRSLMQHNVFLSYLTETGLIGLSLLLWMLFQMTRVSLKIWRNRTLNLWARQFGLLMLAMLVNYGVNGMFHDVSIIPMQHMLLFFLFGLINNIYSKPAPFQLDSECSNPAHENAPEANQTNPEMIPASC